jgi:hypothetical protein
MQGAWRGLAIDDGDDRLLARKASCAHAAIDGLAAIMRWLRH